MNCIGKRKRADGEHMHGIQLYPAHCFAVHPETGELIEITLEEPGYAVSRNSLDSSSANRVLASLINRCNGITAGQENDMLSGALNGWRFPLILL